jgi:hypothetical protein
VCLPRRGTLPRATRRWEPSTALGRPSLRAVGTITLLGSRPSGSRLFGETTQSWAPSRERRARLAHASASGPGGRLTPCGARRAHGPPLGGASRLGLYAARLANAPASRPSRGGPFIGQIRLRRILDEAFHLDAAVSSAATGRSVAPACCPRFTRTWPGATWPATYGAISTSVHGARAAGPRRPIVAGRLPARDAIERGPLRTGECDPPRGRIRPPACRGLYRRARARWEVVCQCPQSGQR